MDDRPSGVDKYIEGVHEDRQGNHAAAISSFNDAIRINPSLRMPHLKLAALYQSEGDYTDAAKQYEIATQLDPYSATNAYNLGVCYQLLHRLADAAAAYLKALDLQPTNSKASMNLGLVYLELGHPADATAYLRRATQLDPKSAEAWSNYGVGLDGIGQLARAERAYRQALELNTSISTLENLAANLIAQKKASESIAVCQQLLLRSDSAISRTRYGQALALSGDPSSAMEQYKLALQRDPQFYLAMTEEAFLLIDEYRQVMELDEPKRESALALWGASLRINPDQPRVLAAVQQWQSSQLYGH
jgi:tetratricopeptide (TPR) repeat protein